MEQPEFNKKELIEKITSKKEFSQLPKRDVELAYEKFEKRANNEYQLVKLTRNFLRNIYSSFSSRKLFSLTDQMKKKDFDVEWYLNKHKSTKERLEHYEEVYSKIFSGVGIGKKISVIDLGAGINGLTYDYFKKIGLKVDYTGVEAVGQLVELMNFYFKQEGIEKNAKAHHLSLFELEKIKELIKKQPPPRVILLFKVIDSLEVVERDYSKTLLREIVPLAERVCLSFATRSLGRRQRFNVQRGWILNFIKENYNILEDFELGGERYLVFSDKTNR